MSDRIGPPRRRCWSVLFVYIGLYRSPDPSQPVKRDHSVTGVWAFGFLAPLRSPCDICVCATLAIRAGQLVLGVGLPIGEGYTFEYGQKGISPHRGPCGDLGIPPASRFFS